MICSLLRASSLALAVTLSLPVQAGSSRTLRRMVREYTREQYLAKVDELRALVPDISLSADDDTNHIRDNAIAARVDLNKFWHVKVEGHFIDGNGNISYARGFYLRSNPTGFEPTTRMLVIRTGVTF